MNFFKLITNNINSIIDNTNISSNDISQKNLYL